MGRHDAPRMDRGRMRPIGRTARAGAVLALVAGAAGAGLAATGHAAESALVAGTPCTRAASACVDLEGQQAWLIDHGAVTRGPVPVSTGGEDEETPVGDFRVVWKHLDHISGESGVPMPFSVFFAPGGIAFHAGDIDSDSAGCVHLDDADAKAFYDALQVGDAVQVRDTAQAHQEDHP